MSSQKFVVTVLSLCALAFVGVAGLNFCINPYAQYPTELFEPLVQTSRAQKAELLTSQPTIPDGLIVGSSRVLKYEPDYLNLRLGQTFFNAGVNYGKSEDHLAFVRLFKHQFGQFPKTLVVGLDVHGFNDNLSTDARLLNNRQLAAEVPEAIPFADRFQSVKDLLSWQQTMSSLRSMKRLRSVEGDESPSESFQKDGVIVYHEREQQIADGEYDFPSALDYNKREYKQLFSRYDKLSQKRLDLFLQTVKTCQDAGSKVVVFLTPMHPELTEYLAGSTTYLDRRKELIQFANDKSRTQGFVFHDLTEIETFGGSADFFVDGIHPLETNTRRAINRLFAIPNEESHYAVQ